MSQVIKKHTFSEREKKYQRFLSGQKNVSFVRKYLSIICTFSPLRHVRVYRRTLAITIIIIATVGLLKKKPWSEEVVPKSYCFSFLPWDWRRNLCFYADCSNCNFANFRGDFYARIPDPPLRLWSSWGRPRSSLSWRNWPCSCPRWRRWRGRLRLRTNTKDLRKLSLLFRGFYSLQMTENFTFKIVIIRTFRVTLDTRPSFRVAFCEHRHGKET